MEKQNRPHVKGLCGAKTRGGTPCRKPAMANGRCRIHGGKSTGPKDHSKNQNAVKHGFFAKYLPAETLAIADAIETQSPAEILWDNIKIQYAAIIRAQRIFYVAHKDDKTVNLTLVGENVQSFETQNAWDKQEKFMNAQSRAMKELAIMLEKYSAMTENEERLLKLERM
ncbi:MAG: HGGxSTG domain-containing protein [Bacillota bacterium]|nr:HGGxSTG domain-containing protein [Bacillota bacterium]